MNLEKNENLYPEAQADKYPGIDEITKRISDSVFSEEPNEDMHRLLRNIINACKTGGRKIETKTMPDLAETMNQDILDSHDRIIEDFRKLFPEFKEAEKEKIAEVIDGVYQAFLRQASNKIAEQEGKEKRDDVINQAMLKMLNEKAVQKEIVSDIECFRTGSLTLPDIIESLGASLSNRIRDHYIKTVKSKSGEGQADILCNLAYPILLLEERLRDFFSKIANSSEDEDIAEALESVSKKKTTIDDFIKKLTK